MTQLKSGVFPAQYGPVPSTALAGAYWDLGGSDGVAPHHLSEWVDGSGVDPTLAAANLESLSPVAAADALAGHLLAELRGDAHQYITATVGRKLRPINAVVADGGWWCSGLDPAADWAPMAWGCFKPDSPRLDQAKGKPRKYEHPQGVATRSFWLRVPAVVAQRVADRYGVVVPAAVLADESGDGGAFWQWWAATPSLPLLLTEGAKKAAALLTVGVPAVALPGVDTGAKRTGEKNPTTGRRTGPIALIPELAAVPLKGRPCWLLFDYSEKESGAKRVADAMRRLGSELAKAGAGEVLVGTCPGPHKGVDDALVAGVSWEQLAAELGELSDAPVLPWLREADRIAPEGAYLSEACPLPGPHLAKVVALQAPMGSGKTTAIAAALDQLRSREETERLPVVLLTHRRSLGAALAKALGLPWAGEAAEGSDLRQLGMALCIDSLAPGSAMRFDARHWRGAVVVIDEAAQVLHHALMTQSTAIAGRRPQVLRNLELLLANAAQVIVADAQLSGPVLEAIETMAGARALLIASRHQPARGRELISHSNRESWRFALMRQLEQRRPLWIATTAQRADAPNSAQNLAQLVAEHWPTARVLVVDSETVANENHPASQLAKATDRIAGAYDVVIATPAIAAGLSVTLRGHFAAVFGWAGGTTDPAGVVQAMARVRDDAPRHLYVAQRSPGTALQIGSGATRADRLLLQLRNHEAAIVSELLAASGWEPERNATGLWLQLWGRLAAMQNGQRSAYRATVLALLEREGYRVVAPEGLSESERSEAVQVGDRLKAIAGAAQSAEDELIATAPLIDAAEAEALAKRQAESGADPALRLNPAERAKLQRYRVATAWGIGSATPRPELLKADRDGAQRRLRFGWMVRSAEARRLVAQVDLRQWSRQTEAWAPDLCRTMEGARLRAIDALGLPKWLERGDRGEWFGADDAELVALQTIATTHAGSITQVLGVKPGKRATTTLRQLLALMGYRLEAKRCRSGAGRLAAAAYQYRVVREALPEGANWEAMTTHWREALERITGEATPRFVPAPGSEGSGFFGRPHPPLPVRGGCVPKFSK